MANNVVVKLKALALLDLMVLVVKLDLMALMVSLVFPVKMVKALKTSIKNPHLALSIALLDHPALLDLLVDLVFEECVDLKDLLASLETMVSPVPLESKDHLVHQELTENLAKLAKKEMMQKSQFQEKDHVELLAHKEKKAHKGIKDQLVLLANPVKLDLLDHQVSKALLAQMESKDLKDLPVQSAKTLNIAHALIATVAVADLMEDAVAPEELVVVADLEPATMATMEATAVMLVLAIVVFVFKR